MGGCSGGTDPRFGISTISVSKLAGDSFRRIAYRLETARMRAEPGRTAARVEVRGAPRSGSLLGTPRQRRNN
jgi:hypothetical protein